MSKKGIVQSALVITSFIFIVRLIGLEDIDFLTVFWGVIFGLIFHLLFSIIHIVLFGFIAKDGEDSLGALDFLKIKFVIINLLNIFAPGLSLLVEFALIPLFPFFIVVIIVLSISNKNNSKVYYGGVEMTYTEDDDTFKRDLATLLATYFFACNEFDEKELKNITSEKLFNEVKKDLDAYKNNNNVHIIDNVSFTAINIDHYSSINEHAKAEATIRVNCSDYVNYSDKINAVVNKDRKLVTYKVIFIKEPNFEVLYDKCPSCSAKVEPGNKVCNYCGTSLTTGPNGWHIDSIKKVY